MIRPKFFPILILLILALIGCGASIDLPSFGQLTDAVATTEPTPFVTMTPLPVIRTVEPQDQVVPAEDSREVAQQIAPQAEPEQIEPANETAAYPEPVAQPETDAPAEPTVQAAPTEAPAEPTPIPEPTATAEPLAITLRAPLENSQFIAGTGIDVSGSATGVTPGQLIRVALTDEAGGQVADASLIGRSGDWRIILPVPEEISGILQVEAKIVAPDGTTQAMANLPIEVIADFTVAEIPENDYFIAIDRLPTTAVAGQSLYLNGRSGNLLDVYDVTIEIYYQECSVTAGPVTFQMYGSGAWNGYLIVPGVSAGNTICVRAHTGTPGTDSYRQAERQVTVLDQADPTAPSVSLATPRPGAFYTAPFDITGIAFQPPSGFVLVQVIGLDGAILWEDTAVPDGFGNWTTTVDLPITSPMSVNIAAIVDNNDGTFLTDKHAITIQPLE